MLPGPSTGSEQPRVLLDIIRGLVRRAGFPPTDSGLDVLSLAKRSLCDCLTLINLLHEMKSEQAKVKSKLAEMHRLEECVWATTVNAEMIDVTGAPADELMSNHASLAALSEQVQAEHDALAKCIHEMEVDAATRGGELGIFA